MDNKKMVTPLHIVGPEKGQPPKAVISISDLNTWYGKERVLKDLSLELYEKQVNCIIGPSGSGKSTLLRCMNRMNDELHQFGMQGKLQFGKKDLKLYEPAALRQKVGMVFQKPCVFPVSIEKNVLFGAEHHKKLDKNAKAELVEQNLKAVSLWKEVRHRLKDKASGLSAGQQQRLCMARCLATQPDVILMDEPTSSLDPISSRNIEELILELKEHYTLVVVSHDIRQTRRIADRLVFMCEGRIIEQGAAEQLFENPSKKETASYLGEDLCDC